MFVSNITPLIIVAGAMKVPSETKTFLIQCTMLVAGINTMIQAYRIGPIGARLPISCRYKFCFCSCCFINWK